MLDITLSGLAPTLLQHIADDPELVESVLDNLAEGARLKWISSARRELGASRDAYIDGIQSVEARPGVRILTLVGWLPNAIENGIEAFDLRETLLSGTSRLAKVSADGHRYGHVPFRHGTPGSAGKTGKPMGRAYGPTGEHGLGHGNVMPAEHAADMGSRVYKAAKRLAATTRPPGGKTRWGGRLPAGMAPKLASHHKTDIFAGMTRVRHTYKRATQTKFMTFRTISEKNPEGWMHPGIKPRGLAGRVDEYVQEHASGAMRAAIKGALEGK